MFCLKQNSDEYYEYEGMGEKAKAILEKLRERHKKLAELKSGQNVSIFDRPYLESLFGGLEFPDGSFAIDEIEDIVECQKVFMEVVSTIRTENMFTFPVLTFSLLYKDLP